MDCKGGIYPHHGHSMAWHGICVTFFSFRYLLLHIASPILCFFAKPLAGASTMIPRPRISDRVISFVYINLDRLFYFVLVCSAHSFFPSLPFPLYPTCALLFSAQVLHRIRPMHLCPVHLHHLRETARTDHLQPCYRALCRAVLSRPAFAFSSHLICICQVACKRTLYSYL